MIIEYVRNNKLVIGLLTSIIFGLSLYVNMSYFAEKPDQLRFFPPFQRGVQLTCNTLLGGEYYYIAEALAAGKGFSNPFQVNTGPTAWMPPLYSFFLALLLKIFMFKRAVAFCVIVAKNLVLVGAGLLLFEIAKRTATRIKPVFVIWVYIFWLLFNFRWFFQFVHDDWFLLAFLCIIFPLFVYVMSHSIKYVTAIVWGVVGGLAMLANPILGVLWVVLCLVSILRANRKSARHLFLSFIIFGLLFSPWLVRNYLVFNKLILIKSNFYFDAYHINYNSKNGIVSADFEKKHHPYFTVRFNIDSLYKDVGEVRFMEIYKEKLLTAIRQNPYKMLHNIKNRLLAALLIYYPYHEFEATALWKSILTALPFVSIIVIVLLRGPTMHTASSFFAAALLIYCAYLLPYVLISYYMRYDIPLTPIKVLFIFWAIDMTLVRLRTNTNKIALVTDWRHNVLKTFALG